MTPKWKTAKSYSDILYQKADGIAKVTINRPEKRNAFRPETVTQMIDAFTDARDDQRIGVVLLTGAGPHTDGKYAFCAGGDQSVRGSAGYVGGDGVPRLNVLDLQKLIRSMPKVVIALVAGYAIGGGHVLHVVCDMTIAASNAVFAKEALGMGLVNAVVPVAGLEREGVAWAQEILQKSPLAIRLLKSGFNAELDGQAGIQELAGNATLLYYMSEEAKEFHSAQREKRKPDAGKFPWLP